MAEALVGDITPVDGVSKEEKRRREQETMEYLCRELLGSVGGGEQGEEIRKAWMEYEENRTLEAKFVHDVDKFELVLQMLDYEREAGGALDLHEFAYVATKVELPEVREWCEEVLRSRTAYWKEIKKEPQKLADAEHKTKIDDYYAE